MSNPFHAPSRIKAILDFLQVPANQLNNITDEPVSDGDLRDIYKKIYEGDICDWLADRGRGLYFDFEYPDDWPLDAQLAAIAKCFPADEFGLVTNSPGDEVECILFGKKYSSPLTSPDQLVGFVSELSAKLYNQEFISISPSVVEYCYILISSKDRDRVKKLFGARTYEELK